MSLARKTRGAAMALVVICAIETAAGSAIAGPAPRWKVSNVFLAAGEPENYIAFNTEKLVLSSAGLGVVMSTPKGECFVTGQLVGSAAEAPGTKKDVVLVCTNVAVIEPFSGCTVKSPGQALGTVAIGPMKSTLVWETKEGEAAGDLYSAEGKGPIGELILEGTLCSKKGTYAIEKEVLAPLTPVAEQTKVATQAFPEAFPTKWWNNAKVREEKTVTQLTLGGQGALLRSSFEVKLNSKEEFGYAPG